MGYAWKSPEMYFISFILNFNILCGAHTVQKHFTVSLKSNKIFCLLLGLIFENYFLTVSNEIEARFWLHFDCFLNHLRIYEEIHC